MTEKIEFNSDELVLEGLLYKNNTDKGVVITHPHPQYGGNMYDFVVESIANAYEEKEYTTLKFNFRGVGKSRGNFDNGIGEQTDLCSAISYLSDIGIKHIDVAGYSFGTWVISQINYAAEGVQNIVWVSPPMGFMDFNRDRHIPQLKLVVTGSMDDFAPPAVIKKSLNQWDSTASLEVIEGADHFYGGYHTKLQAIIASYLEP